MICIYSIEIKIWSSETIVPPFVCLFVYFSLAPKEKSRENSRQTMLYGEQWQNFIETHRRFLCFPHIRVKLFHFISRFSLRNGFALARNEQKRIDLIFTCLFPFYFIRLFIRRVWYIFILVFHCVCVQVQRKSVVVHTLTPFHIQANCFISSGKKHLDSIMPLFRSLEFVCLKLMKCIRSQCKSKCENSNVCIFLWSWFRLKICFFVVFWFVSYFCLQILSVEREYWLVWQ